MSIYHNAPQGVHFIGSVPVPSAHEAFSLLSTALPQRIRRLPDGEPANRQLFVAWQCLLFNPHPQLLNARWNKDASTSGQPLDEKKLAEVKQFLEKLETGYDTAAIESYATFRQLREQGVIPPGVKFQVCIPTPSNTISASIARAYQGFVEPYYVASMVRALSNIQDAIPHADLAIQIDCAHEFGTLEGVWRDREGDGERFAPWWMPESSTAAPEEVFTGVIDRVVFFAGQSHVAQDVELGIHLCYGDIGHKHFVEPNDTGMMVKVANAVLLRLGQEGRRVNFLHLPVPKERDDDAYFAPLREILPLLNEHGAELYLGLVRELDLEGTRRRIDAARRIIGDHSGVTWGCATECGMGRTPKEMVPSLLEIMKAVSAPILHEEANRHPVGMLASGHTVLAAL